MPCSRHGKPRHLSLNARRFQKGEWEALWTQTLHHNNREVAHRAKKLDGKPPAPASRSQLPCARVHATRNIVRIKGALSKANQAMTSELTPSAAPTNINELRLVKYDDDVFYLFLQKQKIALEPYTLPPGTPHHEKRKTHTCDDVTTMTLMVQW